MVSHYVNSQPHSVEPHCCFYLSYCLSERMFSVVLFSADYIDMLADFMCIRERVKFKVACLVRQSLSGQAPLYLADDCRLVSDSTRRSLRSTDVSTCVVPRTLSSYGDRTFAAAGPRLWNSLHVQLRNPDITCGLFRRPTAEGTPFSGSTNTTLCDF